jgi:hypothetical protein
MHHGSVFHLFAEIPGLTRRREASESSSTAAKRPRRNSHLETADALDDALDNLTATIEALREAREVSLVIA